MRRGKEMEATRQENEWEGVGGGDGDVRLEVPRQALRSSLMN
jgi:hypothetical protein